MRLRRRGIEGRSSPNLQPTSTAPPAVPAAQWMAGPEQQFGATTLGAPSETDALGVPAFWAGHSIVCGQVGMLPRVAYRGTDALDPQPAVIRQPDPNQSAMAFWTEVASSLTLYGNSICIVTSRDKLGYPLTLKPIHPTLAAVRFTGNPMAPTIAAWYVAGQVYDPGDIWHIKSHLGRAGWPLGRGIIDTTGDAIAMAMALQTYASGFFDKGGMPIGILKVHRPEITQEQADAAKDSWVSTYAGYPSVAVLNELVDFTPVSFRPVDNQMIESRAHSLIEMALLWSLPPTRLGANMGVSPYKNAQMESVQVRNDGIAPWTTLIAESASIELLPRGQHLQWDLAAALQTDTLSQYQAYQLALGGPGPQSAWMVPDEVRARENMDPMEQDDAELDPAAGEVEPTSPSESDMAMVPLVPADSGNDAEPAMNGSTP